MYTIKSLKEADIKPDMLDDFTRLQQTARVVRDIGGTFEEVKDVFQDDWSLERKREIVQYFIDCLGKGGVVIGALEKERLVGFAVLEEETFGVSAMYRELSYIHVTSEMRGQKVGERLFKAVIKAAQQLGTEKLYIGAHPAVETQAFYRKMGCVPAMEINQTIYDREKLDVQLERDVSIISAE